MTRLFHGRGYTPVRYERPKRIRTRHSTRRAYRQGGTARDHPHRGEEGRQGRWQVTR